MAAHRFDGRPAPQFAFDLFGDAPSLAGDVNLEAMLLRRVVAAIAAVGHDARQADADLFLDAGNDRVLRRSRDVARGDVLTWAREHLAEREARVTPAGLEARFQAEHLFADDDDHGFTAPIR